MTKRDYFNRLKYINDHLILINRYRPHFAERLGGKGVDRLVDKLLDEMIFIKIEIKKIEENENK